MNKEQLSPVSEEYIAKLRAYLKRNPIILSLLYDLDLVPEQVETTLDEWRMYSVISHFMAFEERTKETLGGQSVNP